MILSEQKDSLETPGEPEEQRAAAGFLHECFAEALFAGIDPRSFAEAAIAVGMEELVARYGEDAVADFAARLPERVRAGEFSEMVRH